MVARFFNKHCWITMGNQPHLWRTQSNYYMYIIQVHSVCNTGIIQNVQVYAVFYWNIVAYMVANSLSCSLEVQFHSNCELCKQGYHSVATFLDASKAFDRTNNKLLFAKLIKRSVSVGIVRLLVNWHRQQTMQVNWGTNFASPYNETIG